MHPAGIFAPAANRTKAMSDYALIVGIDRYPRLGDSGSALHLNGPANDADRMEAWFRSQKIEVLANLKHAMDGATARPTQADIDNELKEILEKSKDRRERGQGPLVGQRLYIYLSGHGFSPARRRGCIFTSDASGVFAAHVQISSWIEVLIEAGCFREFVLWMDCCMNRYSQLRLHEPSAYTQSVGEVPGGVFLAFAAQRPLRAVQVPIPEDGGTYHGAFTWALLEGLAGAAADANGLVTSRSLGDWLRNAQAHYIPREDLASMQVSREPDIDEDAKLVFVRGVTPKTYPVRLSFPRELAGATVRLWSGRPPQSEERQVRPDGTLQLCLRPGLYLVEVPEGEIRQGFEVIGPTQLEVEETAVPVVPPPQARFFALEVGSGKEPAEIFVIDTAFGLVDSAVGTLSTALPFGLYKIKVRLGNQVNERVILLDRRRPYLGPGMVPAPATAAPLQDDEGNWDAQVEAGRNAFMPTRDPAAWSGLMLVIRDWEGNAAEEDRAFRDSVSVVDRNGRVVLDFSDAGAGPSAARTASLAPGVYFLRRRISDGTLREQSLVLVGGWILEAFLRHQPPSGAEGGRNLFSLHMRRPDGRDPDAQEARMLEIACAALADERRVFTAQMEEMILGDLRNPMLGIVGAHLLLLEAERDPLRNLSALNGMVSRLRDQLGNDHPDVEALSLRCPDSALRTTVPIGAPPVFARSWQLIVQASQDGSRVVHPAVWERVQALVPRGLYLAWVTDAEVRRQVRDSLAQAILGPAGTAMPAPPQAAMMWEGIAVAPQGMAPADSHALTAAQVARRALQLQVPLSVVDTLRPA